MLRHAIFPVRVWAVLGLTSTIACGSTDPTGVAVAELLVRTDKPVYSLAFDQGASATLINRGSIRVYAPMNEYVFVEQWSGNGWINRRPWFAVDGVGVSLPVAPGDSLVAFPMNFGYVDRRAGVYRFVFEVALDSLGRRLVPEQDRVSEPFEVTW
jgi:hypothetical protein